MEFTKVRSNKNEYNIRYDVNSYTNVKKEPTALQSDVILQNEWGFWVVAESVLFRLVDI